MYRIWFNHWFSSAYRIIELLRKEYKERCYVIGSNDKKHCVYQEVCNEFYVEPIFENENEYVDWAISFCKEHNINVFFPRRNMVAIAKRKDEFIGVTVVLSSDFETMELLNDKAETYRKIHNLGLANVPDTAIATTVEEFKKAGYEVKEYRYADTNRKCYYSIHVEF